MEGNRDNRIAHRIALENSDGICEICGVSYEHHKETKGIALDAHHIDGDEFNNDPENLILVCRDCHRGIHRNKGEEYEEYYKQLPESKQWADAKEWKTMRVPTDDWALAKEQKEAYDRTWGEQIVRPAEDTGEGEQLVCSNDTTSSQEGVVDNATIHNMRDEIMASISAECGDVATVEDIQDLVNRLDDLESTLPAKTAREVREQR